MKIKMCAFSCKSALQSYLNPTLIKRKLLLDIQASIFFLQTKTKRRLIIQFSYDAGGFV